MSRHTQVTADAEETTLIACLQAIAAKTRSSYGSRRMTRALREELFYADPCFLLEQALVV
jgi:hypothetical protein